MLLIYADDLRSYLKMKIAPDDKKQFGELNNQYKRPKTMKNLTYLENGSTYCKDRES